MRRTRTRTRGGRVRDGQLESEQEYERREIFHHAPREEESEWEEDLRELMEREDVNS